MRIDQRRVARRAIDRRLSTLDPSTLAPPRAGWVRAVRDGLGMTTRQLGRRLGVSGAAVSGLEASEQAGTIQLDTLRRVADALECDVVYALVPRAGSLESTVTRRAETMARLELARVDTTMQLEDQSVEPSAHDVAFEELAAHLRDDSSIWNGPGPTATP